MMRESASKSPCIAAHACACAVCVCVHGATHAHVRLSTRRVFAHMVPCLGAAAGLGGGAAARCRSCEIGIWTGLGGFGRTILVVHAAPEKSTLLLSEHAHLIFICHLLHLFSMICHHLSFLEIVFYRQCC